MALVSYESANLFPTHVWSFKGDYVFEDALHRCLKMPDEQQGRVKSNRGGFQSEAFAIGDIPELNTVEIFLNDCLRELELLAAQKYKCAIKLRAQSGDSCWVNINKKGDFNIAHTHPNTAFAFVCYLQVDDPESKLVFNRPDLSLHYPFDNFETSFYAKESYCQVAAGLGLIFPAWLQHGVCENNSTTPRVSVAINVEQY
jgi:uncharacterized protein (TIGR02466 family)